MCQALYRLTYNLQESYTARFSNNEETLEFRKCNGSTSGHIHREGRYESRSNSKENSFFPYNLCISPPPPLHTKKNELTVVRSSVKEKKKKALLGHCLLPSHPRNAWRWEGQGEAGRGRVLGCVHASVPREKKPNRLIRSLVSRAKHQLNTRQM